MFVILHLVDVGNKMQIGVGNKNHIASKLRMTMVQSMKKEFYFNLSRPKTYLLIMFSFIRYLEWS